MAIEVIDYKLEREDGEEYSYGSCMTFMAAILVCLKNLIIVCLTTVVLDNDNNSPTAKAANTDWLHLALFRQ